MVHTFNIDIAKRLDVNAAIFIHNLAFWILKNQNNGKNFHENKYWTYNSSRAYKEHFSYWSQDQIKRIIKKLEDDKIIDSRVLNKVGYDRTKWYTILDKDIVRMYSIHCAESPNGLDEIAQPIPDSKPYNKPNKNSWFLIHLNKTLNRSFRKVNESKLRQRLQTFTSEEIKRAILSASNSKYHIDEGFRYLTPEYFTRNDETIDKWLNAPKPKKEEKVKTFIEDMENTKS